MINTQLVQDIKSILEKEPPTRDDNSVLILAYFSETLGAEFYTMHVSTFLLKMSNKELQQIPTILRYARTIKNKYPDLQGERWKEKHDMQKQVISDQAQLQLEKGSLKRITDKDISIGLKI